MDTELTFERVNPNDLNLRVNPFGSLTSLDKIIFDGYEPPKSDFPNIQNAKRLDKETCKKEGISFDDDDSDAEEAEEIKEEKEETTEEMVRGILNDVIANVLNRMEANELIELQACNDEKSRSTEVDRNDNEYDLLSVNGDYRKISVSEIDSVDGSFVPG